MTPALTLMAVRLHLRLQSLSMALGGSPLVPCIVTKFPFRCVVNVGLKRNLWVLKFVTTLNLLVVIGNVVLSVLSSNLKVCVLVRIGTKL